MLVTKRSAFTGKENQMELDITPEQLERWMGGELIQKVFPHLNAEQREFLMTGCTQEEWDAAMGDEDDLGPDPLGDHHGRNE